MPPTPNETMIRRSHANTLNSQRVDDFQMLTNNENSRFATKSFVSFERNERQLAKFVSLDRTEGDCHDGITQNSRQNSLTRPRVDRCRSHRTLFGCFFASALGGLDLGSLCEFVEVLILAPLSPVQELRLVRRRSSAQAEQRNCTFAPAGAHFKLRLPPTASTVVTAAKKEQDQYQDDYERRVVHAGLLFRCESRHYRPPRALLLPAQLRMRERAATSRITSRRPALG